MIKPFALCLCLLTLIAAPITASAQEDAATQEEPTREVLNRKLSELSKDLKTEENQHFRQIYSNYTLIGTVKGVRGDVQNAITACGENNPPMKADLNKRFGVWDAAVQPVLKEARGNLDNMILAQDYATKSEIDAILAQIDETRHHANNQIKKIPVTTPEACTYLLDKMDETQQTMTNARNRRIRINY